MAKAVYEYDGRTYEFLYQERRTLVVLIEVYEDGVLIPADSLLADKVAKRLFNGKYRSIKEKYKRA